MIQDKKSEPINVCLSDSKDKVGAIGAKDNLIGIGGKSGQFMIYDINTNQVISNHTVEKGIYFIEFLDRGILIGSKHAITRLTPLPDSGDYRQQTLVQFEEESLLAMCGDSDRLSAYITKGNLRTVLNRISPGKVDRYVIQDFKVIFYCNE